MKRTIIAAAFMTLSLSGCQVLDNVQGAESSDKVQSGTNNWCLLNESGPYQQTLSHNCNLHYWLDYWVAHDELSWPKRRDLIEKLDDSPDGLLKKVLLSQAKGTPYQNRLRAQGWADQLLPLLTTQMKNLLYVMIYQPSQERLEYESALTILTRINTNQSKSLDAQQEQLNEQQQQIEKLLKIEASMMEKREGINQ